MRKFGLVLVILIALAGHAWGAKTEIYVNNKPFKGASSGPPTDLLLEAEPYFALAGGTYKFDAATGTATLDGSPIPVTVQGTRVFVRAREMASLVGGRYNANADLGTVDIYAFDPVEAAKKGWARIFALPAITNETDFQVMATLTRGLLTKQLGMELDFPVELVLATAEEIQAASGRAELGGFISSTYHGSGGGIANARIMVLKGFPPAGTMNFLAGGWARLWVARLGLPTNDALKEGFGLWASYYVVSQLGARIPPASWGAAQSEPGRREFLRLLDLEKTGGPVGVVTSVRNLAPGR